ncbi:MAG: protein phosphatase 2C domain-containing protein [Clostridia bacterium]|nr:protein phosphatase 2C domain-containing protein [Clostridia bacterium]
MIPYDVISDVGLVRENNEDSYAVKKIGDYTVLMVADGVGGLPYGEVASRTAIEAASDFLEKNLLAEEISNDEIAEVLKLLYNKVNADVVKQGLKLNSSANGIVIGTTLTICVVYKQQITVAHIGDSRAYLIHGSSIIKLTEDHVSDDDNHFLTKVIGDNSFLSPDIYRYSIMYGDLILLSTDGLHSVLSDNEIVVCLKKHKDLKGCLTNLVEAVYKKGAPDNVTIVLAHDKPE